MDFYWWSARELAGLPGLPGTTQGFNKRAKHESWPHRPRKGRGGGREYPLHALPKETQVYIVKHILKPEQILRLHKRKELLTKLDEAARKELNSRLNLPNTELVELGQLSSLVVHIHFNIHIGRER